MGLFEKFSTISRVRKLELFQECMSPGSEDKILDVGAQINPNDEYGLQLIDSYPWKENITALNISQEHTDTIKKHYPQVDACVGDACDLTWDDNHFDIVYCNAVIEHVGDFDKQKKMASEIMRVSKKWFVTTPNRMYPFEFHMRLPFITWLPGDAYLTLGKVVSYNHVEKKYKWFHHTFDYLRLLTAGQLKQAFPDSRIVKQCVTFMPETLIAIGGE